MCRVPWGHHPGAGTLRAAIAQGVEMGRPSELMGEADYAAGRVTAVRIGGRCVPMMRGELITTA